MRSVESTPARRAIGRLMAASKRDVPHFYVSSEIEVDDALGYISSVQAVSSEHISLTALLVRATVVALGEHPLLNAVWRDGELFLADEANVAVAIALEQGLVAPAVFQRDATSIAAAAGALNDLVSRARDGKLRTAEFADATFTLSNLGMFGVTSFVPIVPPPQVAILGIGRMRRVPTYAGSEIVPRSIITVTVSADHRAVDGADIGRFLDTFKSSIEDAKRLDA
jgi:pyruvate dehydrogenase E2 component (dihydrolipoamide acetyltransferase)